MRGLITLLRDAAANWVSDHAQSMGAALAFYTIFSIAPLLLIVIAVAGMVFGEDAARGEIYLQLHDLLGTTGARAVQGLLESARQPANNVPAAVFGVLLLFVAATSVFAELQDALDRIWRAPQRPRHTGLWRLVRARLLSFGMILGIAFLLIVSLGFSAAMAALSRWWDPDSSSWATFSGASELGLSLLLLTAVFAMIYKAMPRATIAWRDVGVGAAASQHAARQVRDRDLHQDGGRQVAGGRHRRGQVAARRRHDQPDRIRQAQGQGLGLRIYFPHPTRKV